MYFKWLARAEEAQKKTNGGVTGNSSDSKEPENDTKKDAEKKESAVRASRQINNGGN